MPERGVAEQDLWRDLRPLLDEELSRLPDKFRMVIVLCDLEGKTRTEAARQLGLRDGSVYDPPRAGKGQASPGLLNTTEVSSCPTRSPAPLLAAE